MIDSYLAAAYRQRCETPSDIWEHLPRLAELVVETDAQHVIELGVRDGNSTLAFLYGLERTGGRLTSVDVAEAPDIGPWPHWEFIRGDDLDPAVTARMVPADIVFVDTVHTYQHTLNELTTYHQFVRQGGRIVLHDTELRIGNRRPVTDAILEFVAMFGYGWTNDPACNGLGVVQV